MRAGDNCTLCKGEYIPKANTPSPARKKPKLKTTDTSLETTRKLSGKAAMVKPGDSTASTTESPNTPPPSNGKLLQHPETDTRFPDSDEQMKPTEVVKDKSQSDMSLLQATPTPSGRNDESDQSSGQGQASPAVETTTGRTKHQYAYSNDHVKQTPETEDDAMRKKMMCMKIGGALLAQWEAFDASDQEVSAEFLEQCRGLVAKEETQVKDKALFARPTVDFQVAGLSPVGLTEAQKYIPPLFKWQVKSIKDRYDGLLNSENVSRRHQYSFVCDNLL